MKPDVNTAMSLLITEIEEALPFGLSEAQICAGKCIGCPKKLLEYLSGEITYWQCELANGNPPLMGDISRLAHISKKVYRSLERNALV